MTGKELNKWRKRMGWTMEEAAEQLGIARSTLDRASGC